MLYKGIRKRKKGRYTNPMSTALDLSRAMVFQLSNQNYTEIEELKRKKKGSPLHFMTRLLIGLHGNSIPKIVCHYLFLGLD
jgi:hypothetical protein